MNEWIIQPSSKGCFSAEVDINAVFVSQKLIPEIEFYYYINHVSRLTPAGASCHWWNWLNYSIRSHANRLSRETGEISISNPKTNPPRAAARATDSRCARMVLHFVNLLSMCPKCCWREMNFQLIKLWNEKSEIMQSERDGTRDAMRERCAFIENGMHWRHSHFIGRTVK